MRKKTFKPSTTNSDVTYPLVWLHNDGLLILLGHQDAGGEGGLDHVDDQVIGQDVQFLHLVPRHVGASSDAITSREGKRSRVKLPRLDFKFYFFQYL